MELQTQASVESKHPRSPKAARPATSVARKQGAARRNFPRVREGVTVLRIRGQGPSGITAGKVLTDPQFDSWHPKVSPEHHQNDP